MDCSLPGSSVRGILQARVLEWVSISFSRRSFWPRDRTRVSCIVYLGTKKGLEIRCPQAVLSSYVVWVGPGTSSISLQRRNRETREQGQGSCLKLTVVEKEAPLWNRLGQDHGLIPKGIHSILQNWCVDGGPVSRSSNQVLLNCAVPEWQIPEAEDSRVSTDPFPRTSVDSECRSEALLPHSLHNQTPSWAQKRGRVCVMWRIEHVTHRTILGTV